MQIIATDNRKIVVGLGATGLSCVRYLSHKQESFAVVDSRSNPPGLDVLKREFPDVEVSLGGFADDILINAGQLIVSPGISLQENAIAKAQEIGVDICGDIDLFRLEAKAPIVAITGSNGKSTVTTLVGEMARQAGKKVAVGGNLGVPALDLLNEQEPDLYILELSSFQLERTKDLKAEVATVLNVSEDHMDRYKDLFAYHQAKHRVFQGCSQAVINREDPLSKPLIPDAVKVWSFGLNNPDFNSFGLIKEEDVEYLAFEFDKLMPVSELGMAGRHNIENALAALALGKAIGLAIEPMLTVLKSFEGLEHRCQFVAEIKGVRFYNDSKGTNVGAAIASIRGLASDDKKIILIAGGESKSADFSPLMPVIEQYVRAVVVIGEAAAELITMINSIVDVEPAQAMDSAVVKAKSLAEIGDVVLLSPACASFDMFDSYQHRGEVFTQVVNELLATGDVA